MKFRPLAAVAAALAFASCSTTAPTPPAEASPSADLPIAAGVGAAAILPILDAKAGPEKNVFFSPLSVDYAFGIVALGARGETAQQLSTILPPPASPDAYSHNADGVELRLASRLWVEKRFEPAQSYLAAAEARYQAGMEAIDKSKPDKSAALINEWADEKTNGLIPNVVAPDDIKIMLAMIITNAIYFDGDWARKFGGSRMEPFLFGNGEDKPFKLMGLRHEFATLDRKGWRAVRMPYRDRRYAMDVMMPRTRKVMEAAPSLELIDELGDRLDASSPKLVDMKLPQFEIDTDFDLVKPLKTVGLTLPFDATRADLSGMVDGDSANLFVGGAKQLAKLQVFDTGTRAAAVTVVTISVTSARPPDTRKAIEFTVDRPFVVVLRDLQNDAILFLGRIADPQAYEPEEAERP